MNKWRRPNFLPCSPLGNNMSRVTECEAHRQLSRQAAWEGTVLLKNENSLLPLKKGTRVAVFGKSQIDYVKGGGGSGDVTVSYVRNIYQGLKMKREHLQVFDELSLYYQGYVEKTVAGGGTPGMLPEAPLPQALLEEARAFADTAIIVIGRFSGEDWDRKNDGTEDYFDLSQAEEDMVRRVTESFPHVVVLLNVGAMISTAWFAETDAVESALLIWQGGMEGGLAAADILIGEAEPSGRLVDTCVRSFEDYPSSAGFHESPDYVQYNDDIFVGYRYFETVPGKKECVVYPFGYGLSYTGFSMTDIRGCDDGENIHISLTVTNTGSCPGKEVVQVYCGAPEGKLTKAARSLCAFAKTEKLLPGKSQLLHISFPARELASFDDLGVVARSAFVLEKGSYRFYVGANVRSAEAIAYAYELKEDRVTEQLHSYCAPRKLDSRMMSSGEYVAAQNETAPHKEFPQQVTFAPKPEKTWMLSDVAQGLVDLDTFMAQLTDEELCHLVGGQPNRGVANTSGMGNLPRLGIPSVMTVDGPAGVRINGECGVNTTAFPVASALAASWNLDLLEAIGRAGAMEVKENNLSIWLTPALNIHRSPLCGRNFEYYSEDPYVSGKMAAAMTRGIQSQNVVATPKHFACNNKETNRRDSDSILSERALREIYLKGFEICVKESAPRMIMTSYNIINGVRASENHELLYGILRQEWGFDGMITTDWEGHGTHAKEVRAGNDIKMHYGMPQLLKKALEDGSLEKEALYACVRRILEMILWLE